MYITAFIDKLTELNWPKQVNVKPETFWRLKGATDAPLQVIEVAGGKGKSELSFMCEVTKVVLDGHVDRPDKADMTDFEVAPLSHGPLTPPMAEIQDANAATGAANEAKKE